MSTLGDLLAEHTVLPGSAVDHLHAVVGEWQLLADLSFADYLMWVRRDDGALVCVAQCRPNTAPTVLSAMPSARSRRRRPAVGDSGVPVRARSAARTTRTGRFDAGKTAQRRGRPGAAGDTVVAVLTHQTALAASARPAHWRSPIWTAPAICVHMLSEGTFPNVGDLAMSRSSPRVGDGFIRLDVGRRRGLRQPQRALGIPPDGPGRRARGPQPGRHHPTADLRPVRGPGTGRSRARLAGRRLEHADGGRRRRRGGAAAHAAPGGARRGAGRRGADP